MAWTIALMFAAFVVGGLMGATGVACLAICKGPDDIGPPPNFKRYW